MKKISITHTFKVALSELLRAREERYKHLDRFPELRNVSMVSDETLEDGKRRQVRRISLAGSLPPPVAALLPNGALELHETSHFDHATNRHDFDIIPAGELPDIFAIRGLSLYSSVSEAESQRSYEIEIRSKALFVGTIVETTIADLYRNNLEKDRRSIERFLSELSGGEQ